MPGNAFVSITLLSRATSLSHRREMFLLFCWLENAPIESGESNTSRNWGRLEEDRGYGVRHTTRKDANRPHRLAPDLALTYHTNQHQHFLYPSDQGLSCRHTRYQPFYSISNLLSEKNFCIMNRLFTCLLLVVLTVASHAFTSLPSTSSSRLPWSTVYAEPKEKSGDPDEIVARRIIVKGDVQGGYYRSCVLNEVGCRSGFADGVIKTSHVTNTTNINHSSMIHWICFPFCNIGWTFPKINWNHVASRWYRQGRNLCGGKH